MLNIFNKIVVKISFQYILLLVFLLFPIILNGQENLKPTLQEAHQAAFHAAMIGRSNSKTEPTNFANIQYPDQKKLESQKDFAFGNASLTGAILNDAGQPLEFVNVVLYDKLTNEFVKAEVTESSGRFEINELSPGTYFIIATFLGMPELKSIDFLVNNNQKVKLDTMKFAPAGVDLETAEVVARRPIIETRPDRTIFNVGETIISTGSNALSLLRKAPMVSVDNNNDIRILGTPGVSIYIDGRPSPMIGEQLTFYLQSITAEQIDRIEIITNPGSQYDAQGSAGIIDIILKQNQDHGTNGSLSYTLSKGQKFRNNVNGMLNKRTKKFNIFGNGGFGKTNNLTSIASSSMQNDIFLDADIVNQEVKNFGNLRLGTDFFMNQNHTCGILFDYFKLTGFNESENETTISNVVNLESIDSILLVKNEDTVTAKHRQFNLNYKFTEPTRGVLWKVDLNSGKFNNVSFKNQPNQYYDSSSEILLSESENKQELPSEIKLSSLKFDYEKTQEKNRFGFGGKWSDINTSNLLEIQRDSNNLDTIFPFATQQFVYDENTFAMYGKFSGNFSDNFGYDFGLRTEFTKVTGESPLFSIFAEDSVVQFNYFNLFPNLNLSYQLNPELQIRTGFAKRIRRPDFITLNPFESPINDISYQQGNPILNPELVTKYELGVTYKYQYNIKFSYSQTNNQITPFNTPDDSDERSDVSSWDNINSQTQFDLDISMPIEITKWWETYNSIYVNRMKFASTFENNLSTIDTKATSYMIYHQSSLRLLWNINANINFWYQGEGIWNGIFNHDPIWEFSIGLGRTFLHDQLGVELSFNDLFKSTGSSGRSDFTGRFTDVDASWDSRRISITVSYSFGKRDGQMMNEFFKEENKTGQEADVNRVENGQRIFR